MVRNSALLVVICSFAAFSLQNANAFDKEVEKKAAKFLEQKKISRVLRDKLYTGVHPEKKVMSEQQYLQKKAAQFLREYDQRNKSAYSRGKMEFVGATIFGAISYISARNNYPTGVALSGLSAIGLAIAAGLNGVYILFNPDCKTEEDKNAVLIAMLDEKIAANKKEIERYKKLYDSRNRK